MDYSNKDLEETSTKNKQQFLNKKRKAQKSKINLSKEHVSKESQPKHTNINNNLALNDESLKLILNKNKKLKVNLNLIF